MRPAARAAGWRGKAAAASCGATAHGAANRRLQTRRRAARGSCLQEPGQRGGGDSGSFVSRRVRGLHVSRHGVLHIVCSGSLRSIVMLRARCRMHRGRTIPGNTDASLGLYWSYTSFHTNSLLLHPATCSGYLSNSFAGPRRRGPFARPYCAVILSVPALHA